MKDNFNKMEIIFLVALIVFSLAFRLSNLDWEAFSWNEGTHFGGALEFAKGNFIYNFNDYATPPLLKYIGAIIYHFYGFSEILLRSIVALFGVATVVLTYFFARKYYGVYVAALASILVSFSIIHLAFSRLYLTEAVVGFFYLIAMFSYLSLTKNPKRSYIIIFGISLGLAMLTKYISIYLVIALIVHAIVTGVIKIHVRKRFAIEIEHFFLKGIIIAIIVFFVVWPMSLYPIKVHIDANIADFPERDDSFTLKIPGFVLSPEEYITSAFGRQEVYSQAIQSNAISAPVIGYLLLFASKESIIFALLFVAGLITIFMKRKPIDKDILLFLLVFLILLWVQRYGWSYRYLTVIMPIIAIVSARSIDLLKAKNVKTGMVLVLGAVIFAQAAYAYPYYTTHYNFLDDALHFKNIDSEIMMLDGYKEGITFVKANCPGVSGEFARSTVEPDIDPAGFVITNPTKNDLPFCLYVTHGSGVVNSIMRSGMQLRDIFLCTP
ncbi:glycosyltransferase family 39 protein [archaeon]|nr:glycosyltransferase family 39 protein [archaeon]